MDLSWDLIYDEKENYMKLSSSMQFAEENILDISIWSDIIFMENISITNYEMKFRFIDLFLSSLVLYSFWCIFFVKWSNWKRVTDIKRLRNTSGLLRIASVAETCWINWYKIDIFCHWQFERIMFECICWNNSHEIKLDKINWNINEPTTID